MILENGYLLKFPEGLAFSDEEFFGFCQENPEINIERDENRNIIIMSPTGSLSGYYSAIIVGELIQWNKAQKHGRVFDSSSGFTLPDGSVRSPDASWVSNEKWNVLTEADKGRFAPVCPEFVVELRSPTDSLKDLQTKMKKYLKNGAKLAWLIDVKAKSLYAYESGHEEVIRNFNQKVSAKEILPGFELDLSLFLD